MIYDNVSPKISWKKSSYRPQKISTRGLHQNIVLLSVWRDIRLIIIFALLPWNETINSEIYSGQLKKLNEALQEIPLIKIGKVVFQYGTRVGCFTASTLFSGFCPLRFPSVSFHVKQSDEYIIRKWRGKEKSSSGLFLK